MKKNDFTEEKKLSDREKIEYLVALSNKLRDDFESNNLYQKEYLIKLRLISRALQNIAFPNLTDLKIISLKDLQNFSENLGYLVGKNQNQN